MFNAPTVRMWLHTKQFKYKQWKEDCEDIHNNDKLTDEEIQEQLRAADVAALADCEDLYGVLCVDGLKSRHTRKTPTTKWYETYWGWLIKEAMRIEKLRQ